MDNALTLEVLAWVFASFATAKALSDFLLFIAKKTKTEKDDKVANGFAKGLNFLSKILDYFSANTRPKK